MSGKAVADVAHAPASRWQQVSSAEKATVVVREVWLVGE